MKKDIHPAYHMITVKMTDGTEYQTRSTWFMILNASIDSGALSDVGREAASSVSGLINEPFFQGHFPGRPIMPGVLIIEALAQAGGVLAIESLGLAGSGKLVYFMGIDGVKFRKPVEPGHLLDLHVTILQTKRNICKFEGRAMLGDQLATECQFTAMIADPPSD